ncbi:MAG: hypothetical protein KC613_09155, partial [Myxococcales bacterium]|nr:hypothetical protein [Myxococcales bacterium]
MFYRERRLAGRGWTRVLPVRGVSTWLTRSDRWQTAAIILWAAVLAVCAGAYGLLVGPALRALFGGAPLHWPAVLAPWLPEAPSVASLRWGLPWVIVAVAALKALARFGYSRAAARLGVALTGRLQRAVHQRALALPADTMASLGSGAVAALLVHDAPAAQQLWVDGHLRQVRDGLQLVVLLGVCLALDWRMAAVGLLVYPLAFWPMNRLRHGLRRAAQASLEHVAALSAQLTEGFARLAVVQRSGRPNQESAVVSQILDRWGEARVRAAVLGALASPLTELLGAVALAAVLVWSTARVVAGAIAPEHALGFFVALLLVYEPAKGLARAQTILAPGRAGLARIEAFLARPERLPTGELGVPPPAAGVTV